MHKSYYDKCAVRFMRNQPSVRSILRFTGLFGVAFLAYSAGYTRSFLANLGELGKENIVYANRVEIFSTGALPTWIGIMGFAGIGLLFISVIGTIYLGSSSDS